MLEIPSRIWKKIPGYSKPSKVFRTNHENVLCWKANRREDKKAVVIKLFEWDIIEESAAEIKAAQSIRDIDHPNLIKILEVGEDDDIGVYYVMECWGDDLRNTIKVKPDPKIALEIIKQVLEGLSEMHEHKLTHRDIKPENIFLKDGQVKIGDYGLVKSQRFITQLTTIAGTRDYMAPEVLAGKPYDYRCDIYSTGVVLKELLGDEALDGIIKKAMAKDPKDRFQTIEEFITALEHPASGVMRSEPKLLQPVTQNPRPTTQNAQPIFQKLDIQRYPPKPELRGQDDPGILAKTLQAKLDELIKSNDDKSALSVAEEWVKAVEQRFTKYNSRTADAYEKLAGIYLLLGNHQKSEENYRISLEIDRNLYGEPSRQTLNDYYHLAEMFAHAANYENAKKFYAVSLSTALKNTTDYSIIANNIAAVFYYLTEYKEALNLLKEALVINEKQSRFSEPVAVNLYNMALIYEAMGNKGTAEPLYKQAKETLNRFMQAPGNKLTISEQDKQRIMG
ncbi:MAG: serine/threonine-protein kinase [Planctomycetota bacterium]